MKSLLPCSARLSLPANLPPANLPPADPLPVKLQPDKLQTANLTPANQPPDSPLPANSPPTNLLTSNPPARVARLAGLAGLMATLMLAGCTANPRLQQARAVAADGARLDGYADLAVRFRETWPRQRPYLSIAADQLERPADAERRAAYVDAMAIHAAVVAYLRTLGQLAGDDTYRMDAPLKALGGGIKAWPNAGLTDRHVNAYTGLARILARAVTEPAQERAVLQLVRDADSDLQELLGAMQQLLRYFDKSDDNERDTVLGMLDVEIPFADNARERLLAALARAHRQAKAQEYRLAGLRHTLAAKHVAAIAAAHQALLQRLEQPDSALAGTGLAQAAAQLHASSDALQRSGVGPSAESPAGPVTVPTATDKPLP